MITIEKEHPKPVFIADTKVVKESVTKSNVQISAETFEELPPSKSNAPDDTHMDEMDFSILDNDENQFEKKKTDTEEPTNPAESYDQLLSNWENICQAPNEDDNDLLNAIPDDNINFDKEVDVYFIYLFC